jgi:hypothetical protein
MGNNLFVITIPTYDDTTEYLATWCDEVIEFAKAKRFKVFPLRDETAVRAEFEKRLKKHNPRFVMLNGHGNVDCVTGHNCEILLKSGENDDLMKNRIVYALSCWALSGLGKECAKSGTDAFIGYFLPFMFCFDPSRSATPAKDSIANSFRDASNAIPKALLKGNSVSEALFRSRTELNKQMERWNLDSSPDAEWVVSALMNNRDCLGVEGNPQTAI